MRKIRSEQRYQTEKAIIDALLKISEIIKKTTNINQQSKKTTGDGDKKQHKNEYDYDKIHTVPVPPPKRTFDSYISGFNKQYVMRSLQQPVNCNRAPVILWNSRPCDKGFYSSRKERRINNDYRNREAAYKRRRYYDSSSTSVSSSSENYHRKKSLRHHEKRKLSESNRNRRFRCDHLTSYNDNEYRASDC